MQTRLKIFLIASLIALSILILLANTLSPKPMHISEISKKNLNQKIELTAKILSIKNYNNQTFQILKLSDKTGNITATASSKIGLKINYSKEYLVIGKVQEYNRTLQVSIDKLITINN